MSQSASDNLSVPYHLAVIPDGNRRWARALGKPTLAGHRQGLDVAREVALAAFDRGVKVFTLYAFSTENWSRAADEVGYLMDLFHTFLTREFKEFAKRGVRFRLAGQRDGLPTKLVAAADKLEAQTAEFTNGTVVLCLNYGGQQEIADAAAAIVRSGVPASEVTPETVAAHMYAPEVPPVDLIVRSSGEERISGFMLWRAAYAELLFVDKAWPDYTVADLDTALAEYAGRQRRFGA